MQNSVPTQSDLLIIRCARFVHVFQLPATATGCWFSQACFESKEIKTSITRCTFFEVDKNRFLMVQIANFIRYWSQFFFLSHTIRSRFASSEPEMFTSVDLSQSVSSLKQTYVIGNKKTKRARELSKERDSESRKNFTLCLRNRLTK